MRPVTRVNQRILKPMKATDDGHGGHWLGAELMAKRLFSGGRPSGSICCPDPGIGHVILCVSDHSNQQIDEGFGFSFRKIARLQNASTADKEPGIYPTGGWRLKTRRRPEWVALLRRRRCLVQKAGIFPHSARMLLRRKTKPCLLGPTII